MARRDAGDTLIEVIMAVVVISVVVVGAIGMMNRGMVIAQNSLEHSIVRQNVNKQIELLKYLRDEYVQDSSSLGGVQWAAIVSASNSDEINYSSGCAVTGAKSDSAFYLSNDVSGVVSRIDFVGLTQSAAAASAGNGLWVESRLSGSDGGGTVITPAYVDFAIRACWFGVGGDVAQQTVTVERLYDPSR